MAIVTVYNRDETEYGEIDTNRFVFDNNIIGFEPKQINVKIYPYVKINGKYYKNDGLEFFSVGRTDNSAGLTSLDDMFKIEGLPPEYIIHVGDEKIYNDDTAKSTSVKESLWDAVSKVPGYGVQEKALLGTFLPAKPTYPYGYFYENLPFIRRDGESINNPLYWTFIPGNPFIVYSNLNSDYSYTTQTYTLPGHAWQPYNIVEKGWLLDPKRDEVHVTNTAEEWWRGSGQWLEISTYEADAFGKTKWMTVYEDSKPTQITKYIPSINAINIDPSTGSVNGVVGLIDNNKKVILVKRPLISLQSVFDKYRAKRFFMLYATSYDKNRDTVMVGAYRAGGNYNFPDDIFEEWGFRDLGDKEYGSGVNYSDFLWWTSPYKWKYGYLDYYDLIHQNYPFVHQENFVELDVKLPDLEFYDVTSLITTNTTIQDLMQKTSNLTPVDPIWKKDIVIKSNETINFNFSKEEIINSGLTHCHGGVQYELSIGNIQSLKTEHLSETPQRYVEYYTRFLDKAHDKGGRSTISASILFTDVFEWKTPRWFCEHFVNLGWDEMGVCYSNAYFDYRSQSSDVFPFCKINSNRYYQYEVYRDDDPGHDYFSCYGGVSGWRGLDSYTKEEHIVPMETTVYEADKTPIKGRYAKIVNFLNPLYDLYDAYEDGSTPVTYYKMSPYNRNGLGVQLGLTTGILINYPNTQTVNADTYDIPDETEDAVALIVCDEY